MLLYTFFFKIHIIPWALSVCHTQGGLFWHLRVVLFYWDSDPLYFFSRQIGSRVIA